MKPTKNRYPDWKDYEKQIFAAIKEEFPKATVTFNDSIKGKESKSIRQIDVSVRFKENRKSVFGIVECKYFARKVDIGKIDALIGKMVDTGAHFALIFTSLGFTKGAEQFAKECNIGFRQVPFEFLKDFGYVPANGMDDVFMQEITYNEIYCEKCRKLNFYEIKVVRGFADFNEDIICPECKTPHLKNVRTDGGYKVIKRFNKKSITEKEYKETIVCHLIATREEWDKKHTFLWEHLKLLPKDELCFICSKHLDQGFPGTMPTEHEGKTICFECMMSQRTLLLDSKIVC